MKQYDVQYKTFNRYGTNIHVLIFDPKKVSIVACVGDTSKKQPLPEITHAWMDSHGYTRFAAINASFFDLAAKVPDPLGVDMRDGGFWYGDSPKDDIFTELIQVGTELHVGDYTRSEIEKKFPNASYAMSLGYPLVIDGEINTEGSDRFGHDKYDNPRTMIGQLQDGRHIWAVTDGRGTGSTGLTAQEQAVFMKEIGCKVAISADGGGSSEMEINGTVVNKLEGNYQRQLPNALLMYYKERPKMDLVTSLGFQPTLYIGDGHGMETAGKRTPVLTEGPRKGTQIQENEFNSPTANYMGDMAKAAGFRIVYTAPGNNEPGLTARTNLANADFAVLRKAYPLVPKERLALYISIHYNATSMGYKWVTNFKGGIETFYWEKDGKHSATGKVLAEKVQARLIEATGKYNRGAKGANWHVNRETHMTAILTENGFMDYLPDALDMLDTNYQKKNAKATLLGIFDYLGLDYKEYFVDENKPDEPDTSKLTAIMGTAVATKEQAKAWLQKVAPEWVMMADIFYSIAPKYNIRADVALAQSCKETGYFRYGGLVKPWQNNFAGIAATGQASDGNTPLRGADPKKVRFEKDVHGAIFVDKETGVEAQIQHLYAYATKEPLPEGTTLYSPRFTLVQRGTAPYVDHLGAGENPAGVGWAYPGKDYGKSIIEDYLNKLLAVQPEEPSKDEDSSQVKILKEKIKELEEKTAKLELEKAAAQQTADDANKRSEKYINFTKQVDTLLKEVNEYEK
ncbi:MAG: N-acetylmuramoyl-L-alanine amidase [Vallitaleaceae bacterium]|nr:N-acetylmuramoyl-L-alanine amidase [Vallitaleaceae bacterium]